MKNMRTRISLSLLAAAALVLPSYGAFTPVNGASLESLLGLGAGGANTLQIYGPGPNTGANEGDEIWTTAIGNRFSTLIIEVAGNANNNEFGIYKSIGGVVTGYLPIFPGPANPNLGAPVSLLIDSGLQRISKDGGATWFDVSGVTAGQFGFYLNTGPGNPIWYSDTSLNPLGADQMVTYDIANTIYNTSSGWVLAWEDLRYAPSDKDFNDLVVTLTTAPIPEPTTMIAGLLLLLPFAASTVRFLRKNKAA
jgi:hypothetical protein